MAQPDIVKIIQRCDTWSAIDPYYRMDDDAPDDDTRYGVTVYFEKKEDADAFKIELMMVASGQRGYEKDAA